MMTEEDLRDAMMADAKESAARIARRDRFTGASVEYISDVVLTRARSAARETGDLSRALLMAKGMKQATAQRAIDRLKETGEIVAIGRTNGTYLYKWLGHGKGVQSD